MTDERKEVALDALEVGIIEEFASSIAALQHQRNGALMIAIRRRGLQGIWDYRDGKLVPTPDPPKPELARGKAK